MTIESPCVNICALDETGAFCIGCQRTLDEIARWSQMTPEERRRLMGELLVRGLRAPAGRPR